MDERLQQALDFSNYMVTLNNQKRILREKFKESIIYYYKGSQFTSNQNLISFINFLIEKTDSDKIIVIDDNQIPVCIDDPDEFLNKVVDTYISAAEEYHTEYQKLIKNRSTEKLVEYESE